MAATSNINNELKDWAIIIEENVKWGAGAQKSVSYYFYLNGYLFQI